MKMKLLMAVMFLSGLVGLNAQVMTPCTPEWQQYLNYQKQAASVSVINTQTQQLQTYYQQLATYYQQLDKTNQQLAKDVQQKNKDIQQKNKDDQQTATDKALALRLVELENLQSQGYDELRLFIEALLPLLGNCDAAIKDELKIIHTNRSGQADGTNPGGQTHNLRGFDNPHKVR